MSHIKIVHWLFKILLTVVNTFVTLVFIFIRKYIILFLKTFAFFFVEELVCQLEILITFLFFLFPKEKC